MAVLVVETFRGKILGIPIGLYSAFVLEEKYGFNKKTLGLFFYDELMGTLLNLVICPIFLYGFLWVMDIGGEYFFLYG